MKKIFSMIILNILAIAALALPARGAQDAQAWITWRAVTYIPSSYAGRSLPIENADVVVAVDVVSGGKPVNLANQNINWFVNDSFLKGGPGMTRTVVHVPDGASIGGLSVRVNIPDYGDGLAKTVKIPVVHPEVNLQYAPVAQQRQFQVTALPFYFNVFSAQALAFTWNVAGQTPPPDAEPDILNVSMDQSTAAGMQFPFSVTVKNPDGVLEAASANGRVTYNP